MWPLSLQSLVTAQREYEVSPCLRKDPQGVCSPGLRLVTSTLPGIYAWSLFKYAPRKL